MRHESRSSRRSRSRRRESIVRQVSVIFASLVLLLVYVALTGTL